MTDSENSQPQDDSDEDIYKDIPEFNFEEELAKLEGSKETYKQEASDLSEKVKMLTQENKELKKLNEVLKKNLSTLLKTAQAEIQRKDSMIEELRCKCNQDCEKKTGLQPGKEENSNCGEEKSGYHRENAQNANFRHSDSNRDARNEKRKEKKSTRYDDSSGHRRPFRENHRDHLQYDSYDKKRHSRSSDNRFLSRRRSSRERRRDRRRSDSCERRKRSHRRDDSSERSRRRGSKKEKSRSRGSKESSLEKPKSKFSLDSNLVSRTKEGVDVKSEVSKGAGDGVENKKRVECSEKKRNIEESVAGNGKNKQNKEKGSDKSDKRKNLELFSTKSPLDALYDDMVASRSFSQFSNSKEGVIHSESDLEEGELFATGNESLKTSQVEEDWTLSFKNERRNETKPMTLYSRRMMQKFSSELKEKQLKRSKEGKRTKEKSELPAERKSLEKLIEMEKEPGELTDDENVIESSKEFQELTKVAALESEIIEKPATECSKEFLAVVDVAKIEPLPKDRQLEVEKCSSGKEESFACKDMESKMEVCDIIEFSPFKNNYKLIEISPIKPAGNGHILDFYNIKVPSKNLPEQVRAFDSSEEKTELEKGASGKLSDTSGEKDSWKNSSSENNLETELKIVIPSTRGSSKESEKTDERRATTENKPQEKEDKEPIKKREKKSKAPKEETNLRRGKRPNLKRKTEKSVTDERTEKRKRKFNDEAEAKSNRKKPKLEKSEPPRKSKRSKRNSKSEPESQSFQEAEVKPAQEPEIKLNEDTSSCEFFKPIARAEALETPVDIAIGKCPATDYKIAATMSVTGVVRLDNPLTPNKCMGKLKNLMINEQMIFNILDSKNNSQFSPLIGSKSFEMTPRRMLKNDLMLTDSEDDSVSKRNAGGEDVDEVGDEEEDEEEEEQEEEGEESGLSGSEYSDRGSDSGASDFVDLL